MASSCFKIIGCGGGGDAVDNDDLAQEEAKVSSDKRRWSFRKRSSKQRVLSNTVISEPVSVCSSKESHEISTTNFHSPKYSLPEGAEVQEKPIETSPLPAAIVNTEAPPSLSDGNITPVGPTLIESDAIVVQAAIRGYLAKKKLHKLKSVVKLQAAVRGHMVRRQAIGTLRCIQAIIRMQALIRARYALQLVEKLTSQEDKKFQEKGDPSVKSNKTSIKQLLSNGFARQLLETTPRTKTIYIKCDPLKSDSTWKWLERWMAVTAAGGQQHEQNFNHCNWALEENTNMADGEPAKEIAHAVSSALSDPMSAPTELIIADDCKNSSAIENGDNFEFQTSLIDQNNSFNLRKDDAEKSESKNELLNTRNEDSTCTRMDNEETLDCISDNKQFQPNQSSEIFFDTVPEKLESGKDSSKHSAEGPSYETLENEGKKSVIGSRKACNPAFVAAQSKFEELSSKSAVGQSVSSAYQDAASNSKTDSHNIQVNSFTASNEVISAENSIVHDSGVQAVASECGTEISVSSTLDSPDRSEMEGGEIVLEIGALEKENYSIIADADNAFDLPNMGGKGGPDGGDQTMVKLNASINTVQNGQHPAEQTTTDVQTYLEGTIEQPRSPEGTPRTHATVPEPHGTPSSDVSVKTKKNKKDNDKPTHRQRSQLDGKRSPSNPNNDSSGRSSTEQLTKDSKIPKRRNSFGMTKTDNVEQEPRLSSSNSLPSYMQATASARAKAHVSTSQKASPDLHDNQPKKRHSLPIENGKQTSSPRMQRSASQAQQSAKGSGAHSPHTSAERRWQR